jgi:hypothetical protein
MIPKPQYTKSLLFYQGDTLCIVYDLRLMLSSVNLNDYTLFQAYEIDNIASKRVLSAEFTSSKLAQSEVLP